MHTHAHTHTHTRMHARTHTHTHTHTHTTQGYKPVIFYPKRTSKEIYQTVVTQCETLHIPFIDKLPTAADIDSKYHVIVDAIFGFSFKGAVRAPFDAVLATLKQVKKPLASVDVPSGVLVT